MDEIWRVLKDKGTVWINLGDSYSGSMGTGWKCKNSLNNNDTATGDSEYLFRKTGRIDTVQRKCLLLIPHRFAIGCIDRGWILRNTIIWAKRNGMPESVKDRFAKKHEYLFFMTKRPHYYFDIDTVREHPLTNYGKRGKRDARFNGTGSENLNGDQYHPKGKNPGDVSDFWDIPVKAGKTKHIATYNEALIIKPVLCGCPEGGVILDPFMGTGSTAEVAIRAGRLFIGIEASEEYCEVANKRLAPLLAQKRIF